MNAKGDILFINRDEDFLKDLGNTLRESGYSVRTAIDMRGALSVLSSNSVGLIVCDNTLKDVSGFDFLRFLKNDPLRERIPFIFLVPLDDQGRPIKAFKLGAADFIVYPLEPKVLISRIGEVFSSAKGPAPGDRSSKKGLSSPGEKAAEQGSEEKRRSKRVDALLPIRVEVSRNGILWMPGQIRNISRRGVFLETALLGKPGVELHIRMPLPTGASVVKGHIKHIDFKNCDPSAGIGVEVEDSKEWKDILKYLAAMIKKSDAAAEKKAGAPPDQSRNAEAIVGTGEKAAGQRGPRPEPPSQKGKDDSFDIRFYHSLIGKQLDNYKILSFIGAGAMGGVFKGWDIALERPVALKVISYKLSARETFRELFIKEARFVSKLDHQNIAHIYYIGNVDQILYFAMEFVDGVTLSKLIKSGENLNTLKGLNFLVTICEALDFVSQKNIIHRDIKPANIMINRQGLVKIVDFGVARMVDMKPNDDRREGIVGSPLYISPDCVKGLPLDRRSDIYSLGASFYHAFTGHPPFEGEDADEILLKHIEEELTSLRKRNPKVSNALGKIIEKMMAKEPEDRYQDYKEIVKDLQTIQSRALKFQKLKNATLIFKVKPKIEKGKEDP